MSNKHRKSGFSRFVRLASLVAAVAVVAAACGSGSVTGGSTVAASVGDDSITRSELEEILSELPQVDGVTVDAAGTASFLSNWLFIVGLRQEFEADGFSVTQAHIDEARAQIEESSGDDLTTAFGMLQLDQRAIQLAAEDYLEAEVSALPVDAVIPEYLCSSHILLETVEEAEAVGQRLADGEDFATLAAEVSTGPSGPNGGDLRCVDTSTFVPEFIEGARVVAPSGLTGPVQSQFGFHVIEVRSMGPLSADNHPEMSQVDIDSALQASIGTAQSGQRDSVIQRIVAAVNERISESVTIDPRYGEWSDGAGIVPPDGVTDGG